MKKVFTLLITFVIIFGMATVCFADEEVQQGNVEFKVTENVQANIDDKAVTLTISLGNFTGAEDGCVLGFEGTLEYETTVFKSIVVSGLNGWTCNYDGTTKIFMGDTASAKQNTDICTIVLTFADDLSEDVETVVSFNNIEVTDDNLVDSTYNVQSNISITKAEELVINTSEKDGTGTSTTTKTTTTATEKSKDASTNADNTVATKSIPQTGINEVALIVIMVILVIGIVCFIRYKMIKTK